MATPTLLPQQRDLIGHSHSRENRGVTAVHTVHFDYPDCTRSFDGEHWTMAPKDEDPPFLPGVADRMGVRL